MQNSQISHLCHYSPFRPVAETSRMMHYTQLVMLLLAGIAVNIIRGDYSLAMCIVPLLTALLLEKLVLYCRCGGHRGSTAHSLILAILVCYILPSGSYWLIASLVTAFAVIYKHLFNGLGGYILHPALLAVAGLELVCRELVSNAFASHNDLTGMVMSINYDELLQLTFSSGKLNIEDVFVNRLPTVIDCLLGREMPAIASCPIVFAIFGIYCIYRGYLNWRVPAVFIISVIAATILLPIKCETGYYGILASGLSPDVIATYVIYHLFTGYVFFSATALFLDTTSRPLTVGGQVWMAFFAGTVVILFRLYLPLNFAEIYAVLLVGLGMPVFNMITRPSKRYS